MNIKRYSMANVSIEVTSNNYPPPVMILNFQNIGEHFELAIGKDAARALARDLLIIPETRTVILESLAKEAAVDGGIHRDSMTLKKRTQAIFAQGWLNMQAEELKENDDED